MDALSHRKAGACVRLIHADGTPAAHREIAVDQTAHRFLFGCGAFESMAAQQSPDPARRALAEANVQKWLGLFNYGTLPFYWGRYEPVPGHTAKEATMAAAQSLRAHGVTLKGHPLCWHTVCADWLLAYDNEEIFRRQIERIHREVSDFRGVISLWDVINEVVIMPDFDKYDNAVTRLCREKGRVALVKAVFEAAKACDPNATLLINDFNTSEAYAHLIEDLLSAGVPIGAIGIQSHQHQGFWGLGKLGEVLHRFERFGLPLHFTENTLISGHLMPPDIVDLNDYQVDVWPTTPEGEARQAEEIATMYSALFAHPLVEAITSWDFTDDCWLHAPAGLLRADGTEKPAYEALRSLIHGAWETHERLVTDADGCLRFTGFKGDYRLACGGESATLSLDADAQATLTLRA